MAVRARALLRSNVGPTLALLVLAGLAAGFALGAWGASRRGAGAFGRFLDHAQQAELSVFVCATDPATGRAPCSGEEELASLRALPVVAAAARVAAVPVRYEIPGVGNLDAAIEVIIDGEFPTPEGTPIVVEGRLLDPAADDEVVLPEGSDAGLGAGTVFAITPLRLGGPSRRRRSPSSVTSCGRWARSASRRAWRPGSASSSRSRRRPRSARAGGSATARWSATTASSSRCGRCPAPTRRSSGPRSPPPWASGSWAASLPSATSS